MIRAQLSILLVSVVAACGGNSPIAIKDLPQKFNDADCANEVECDEQPDNTTCEASLGNNSDSESLTLIDDVNSGKVKYDSGAAQSCLDEISNNPCDFSGLHDTATDCVKIFTGTIATGAACDIDQECVSGSCTQTDTTCDRDTTCCMGTCAAAAAALAAVGAACDTNSNPCVDTAYCKQTDPTGQTSTAGTCAALVTASGGACDSDVGSCANPLYCNLDFTTGIGTCKAPAASGAACLTTDLLPCVDDRQYCDPTMMKCLQKVAVGGACPANVLCEDLATCVSAVCVANPGLGATCDGTTSGAPLCLGNLSCTNSKCTAPASGPACTM